MVPGQTPEQLTQNLFVFLLKTHLVSLIRELGLWHPLSASLVEVPDIALLLFSLSP